MGLTERHWFENEDVPENYEWALEDAVHNSRTNENPEDSTEEKLGVKGPKAIKPICKIIFDVPYYFCGDCKAMLNMYSTKAKFCSQCGQIVQW